MKTTKFNSKLGKIFTIVTLCMFVAATAAFADYINVSYTNSNGETEPAILTRCNNSGHAIGIAGDGMIEFLMNFGVLDKMVDMTGLVCTDINTPTVSTTVYNPTQLKAHGKTFDLSGGEGTELDSLFYRGIVVTLKSYTFLPLDINDNDTMVGAFVYKDIYDDIGVAAFIADYPWTLPMLVCGTDDNGDFMPAPYVQYGSDLAAFATGIDNSGDIVGVMAGFFGASGYASLTQGYIFNRRAIDSDGLLAPDEFSVFNCSGSVMTFPLSINNSGNITGYTVSLKYPLEEGSYMLDIDGNYLLSDDDVRIPAGRDNISDLATNLLKPKYLEIKGFVMNKNSLDTDIRTVDLVNSQAVEAEQVPGVVEIYGTIPYTILDSDRVLFAYTNVNADNDTNDALLTLNDLLASLLDPDSPPVQPSTASLVFGQSSPPNYDLALAQGYSFPGSTASGFGDINTSGVAVGGYAKDGVLEAYIYTPGVCVEDNSGSIDIMGAPACITTDDAPLYVPIRVQAAPNDVHALGFEVVYDPNILGYVDFVTDPADNNMPSTLLSGWQVSGNETWSGTQAGVGLIRIGAFTNDSPIRAGQEGILGYLVFHSVSAEETHLDIQALTDDIADWTASGACLAKATGDCNDDGVVTPADALCAFEKALGVYDTDCGDAVEIQTDVDADNDTDMYDVLCIFKYYLGLPSCLGTQTDTEATESVAF